MIESDVIQRLLSTPAVTQLVDGRIYPQKAPQGKPSPWVAVTKVSAPRDKHMGGHSGLVDAHFQVSAFGTGYLATKELIQAIRLSLQNPWLTKIRSTTIENEMDLTYQMPGDASDEGKYHIALDLRIWHTEATN